MKLKKIASLALAGIMAVSMLAGCKDGTSQEDPSSSSQVPATTDVVTYANDALSGPEKEVMTFTNSDSLNTLLQKVATDPSNFSSKDIADVFDDFTLRSTVTNNNAYATDLTVDMVNGMTGQRSNAFAALDTLPVDKSSQKVVVIGIISGNVEEKAAVQKFVDAYAGFFDSEFPAKIVDGSDSYACDYAGEISAIKVTNPENSNESAWVMAIVATQTVTKTANASV